ncbi:hypothetical protein AZO1586I_19 [Bathymodiolus thermophilus thioautotrophic gill symbiont]|uniref:Uncharacterized protein n=1 Tax=Bathymodiolus thermophilus thioautotrophic gill symbiont TaxID=2360 RepID=A0ABM8M6E0_9GAMM|nr:hypothetical protein AZO1586I_19 [Bathymodiolus thermophilus thioautotrophic gill symbiont]
MGQKFKSCQSSLFMQKSQKKKNKIQATTDTPTKNKCNELL